jgi:2-amino-4-hydroxy-6-hydroxymethyldihydropteridine diphosphokinase
VPRVAIALGSNLGDRRRAIAFAVDRLASLVSAPVLSDLIETEPAGEGLHDQIETEPAGEGLHDQPLYLNAVLVGDTGLGARALLDGLQQIETDFGRERPFPNAPRTLDLDLILYGDALVAEPGLEVPHPRFRERFFVLGPLAEIAPDMKDPLTGMKVWELLRALLRDESR